MRSAVVGTLAGSVGGFFFAMLVGFVAHSQNGSHLIPVVPIAQLLWLCLPFSAIGLLVTNSEKSSIPGGASTAGGEGIVAM
jgi:hypothetical protein